MVWRSNKGHEIRNWIIKIFIYCFPYHVILQILQQFLHHDTWEIFMWNLIKLSKWSVNFTLWIGKVKSAYMELVQIRIGNLTSFTRKIFILYLIIYVGKVVIQFAKQNVKITLTFLTVGVRNDSMIKLTIKTSHTSSRKKKSV